MRSLTFALLVATTAAGAYPRSDLPSISFDYKDWELACDNTRTCRAAGYHPEDDEPNATILLTRAAGPNQAVTVQLQLADDERHPAPDQLTMTVDGHSLGTVRIALRTHGEALKQAAAGDVGSERVERDTRLDVPDIGLAQHQLVERDVPRTAEADFHNLGHGHSP